MILSDCRDEYSKLYDTHNATTYSLSQNRTTTYSQQTLPYKSESPSSIQDSPSPEHTLQTLQSQHKITKWATHCPFIPDNPFEKSSHTKDKNDPREHMTPQHPHQVFVDHLTPYGTSLPPIDKSNFLCICMQNTQHSFNIFDDMELPVIIDNLKSIGASMFIPISPNVNWKMVTNWAHTRHLFRPHFQPVHLLAVSSDIGDDPHYFNKHLVGSAAILSCGLWVSKVSQLIQDQSGYGTFAVTTLGLHCCTKRF